MRQRDGDGRAGLNGRDNFQRLMAEAQDLLAESFILFRFTGEKVFPERL